jgi:hypothetical protein
MRNRIVSIALLFLTGITGALAQFNSAFLQNNSYWGDGKAEFDIYDAQIVLYGQPRPCEVLHILVREPFDPKQLVKPDDWKRPGMISVLKLNQILHVPTGIYVYQQMHSNFWRIDDGQLLKFSLTSDDSCGNTFKEARRTENQFEYKYHTYWDGMADGKANIAPPANGCFYDELPLRVRTIDFTKGNGQFEIQLTPTIIKSKKDEVVFKAATVSFTVAEKFITVSVQHDAGKDQFTLDREFPFLLREWSTADGSYLKLKRSLKIDYWNYDKVGDKERALSNPMLQHPD